MKFTADRTIHSGPPRSYRSPEDAANDPLARAVFDLGQVASVLIVGNFVTVNKKPSARWGRLTPKVQAVLSRHLDAESASAKS